MTKMSKHARGILQLKFLIVAILFRISAKSNIAHVHIPLTKLSVITEGRIQFFSVREKVL